MATALETTRPDNTRSRRVLFVDDSRLMRYAGTRFLSGKCEVRVAEHGREAWRMLNTDKAIDLVFTDLMMPIMDGHELIRHIRSSTEHRIRQLPVLVVSSEEESAARELAITEGATGFITKPFTPSDLQHAVDPVRPQSATLPQRPRISGLPDSLVETDREPRDDRASGEPARYCEQLQKALSFHQRQQLDLALLHIQFQGYWYLRNRYGERWADAVMRNLDRILTEQLRLEDSIHRTADDLFSIILMGTDRRGARVLSARLRQQFRSIRMRFTSMVIDIDLRFAIQFPDCNDEEDPAELLENALRLVHWRSSPGTIA